MHCLLFGRRHLFRAVLAASLFVASPPAAFAQIRADVYISGPSSPLAFIQDPSNASVQYIVQQGGRIRVVVNGVLQSTDFLTLTSSEIVSSGEQGLLGLAFPPDYATSGRFYVNFTNTSGHTVVARFKRSTGNPLVADKSTRFDLRWPGGNAFITQPFSNHNGGTLAFGPDGYLYIGMGDGGSVNDPQNNAQNPNSLLGKMLRISAAVPDSDPEEQTAEECGMERIDYAKSLVAMYQSPPSAASMDNPLCDVVHTKFGPRPVFPSKISVGSELAKLCNWHKETTKLEAGGSILSFLDKVFGREDPPVRS